MNARYASASVEILAHKTEGVAFLSDSSLLIGK